MPKKLSHSVAAVTAAVAAVVAARMKPVTAEAVEMEADRTGGCCPCLYCLPHSKSR